MTKRTTLSRTETEVLETLPRSRGNAKPVNEIAKTIGMDARSVHSIIADLCIKFHIPIVSTRAGEPKGVFIATTEEEKLRGLSEFESQVRENQKRIDAVKKANVEKWPLNIVYHYQVDLLKDKPEEVNHAESIKS